MDKWVLVNNVWFTYTAPHKRVDATEVYNGSLFSKGGLVARWTSHFDCEQTCWWYVIKDTPFDISSIKSKRRNQVNKGIKNFIVKVIDPILYREQIYEVYLKSLKGYSEATAIPKEVFFEQIKEWVSEKIYGAFSCDSGELEGFAMINVKEDYCAFSLLKTNPESEKLGVNFAIVNKILVDLEEKLKGGYYVCDGQRSVYHQTNFQDFLEKYFDFRKAYCRLNIVITKKYRLIVNLLYPLRKILYKAKKGKIHKLSSVLKMLEITKKQKKQFKEKGNGDE